MITEQQLNVGIRAFSQTMSSQLLGLALYRPELWAAPTRCFENVFEKVRREGGRTQFGWTFHHRFSPQNGDYLMATHHAVWHATTEQLIDITPMHEEERHKPIVSKGGDVLFLVDDSAEPVQTDVLLAPLPLRYFALDNSKKLQAYVAHLQREEVRKCQKIYKLRST